MSAHNEPCGGVSIPLLRVTSLRRRARANAPAASYWLRRVLDDGGRRDWTSPSCKGCTAGGEVCHAPLITTGGFGGGSEPALPPGLPWV